MSAASNMTPLWTLSRGIPRFESALTPRPRNTEFDPSESGVFQTFPSTPRETVKADTMHKSSHPIPQETLSSRSRPTRALTFSRLDAFDNDPTKTCQGTALFRISSLPSSFPCFRSCRRLYPCPCLCPLTYPKHLRSGRHDL